MDKADLIELYYTFLHHKDVENKEHLLNIYQVSEVIGYGLSDKVTFEQKDMTYLRNLIIDWDPPQTILYVVRVPAGLLRLVDLSGLFIERNWSRTILRSNLQFSFANMDKEELIELYKTCLHHKDVENKEKENLLKSFQRSLDCGEFFRNGHSEEIGFGLSDNVTFERKDMTDLRNQITEWNPTRTILYVGGTVRNDPEKRAVEHERKFRRIKSFYYCRVQNVKSEETGLLQLGKDILKQNGHKYSNCREEPGFVVPAGVLRLVDLSGLFIERNWSKTILRSNLQCRRQKKEDLLKAFQDSEVTGYGLPDKVTFEQKDMTYLRDLIIKWDPPQTILYVGGTVRKDAATRAEEHQKTKFCHMTSFYYCRVQDVKSVETELLQLGGDKLKQNVHKKSNCRAEPGFVYVLDTGLIS
ncbi:unnamed protein product [Mytilus edulis]|uniref:Uncharacterized protein n=1 Tax=Mytilus edulis TaxID=6550 RepID=A0A8S3TY27_MYTED|nr:unnamed protein product [Mytilus edulis]